MLRGLLETCRIAEGGVGLAEFRTPGDHSDSVTPLMGDGARPSVLR